MSRAGSDEGGPISPGSGRRRGSPFPKGRVVDPAAIDELRELIGGRSCERDQLIELLHVIQDHHGHLPARLLLALADAMKLAFTEVFEVATFYAHFDVIDEGETPPAPLTVRVCESLTCALSGAGELYEALHRAELPGVRVVRAPCQGRCERAPSVMVGRHAVAPATETEVRAAVAAGRIEADLPSAIDLRAYQEQGGYRLLAACRQGETTRDSILERLEAANLRGLGGAGFPTARKWRSVLEQPAPRLMAVNADEGEPGTFKDRHYLETDPHRVLEGMLVAAWVVEAESIYFYLRDEYPHLHALLRRELDALAASGLIAPGTVHLRRGAGAYICGEETAMLESIEGKRGYPRHKPPFPTQVGLFGRPTLINNVETLYWVRAIVDDPQALASHGRNGRHGLRSFSVSGRVAHPGVKLAPAGITVRELIDEFCGGLLPGHQFAAYLPGGASGGILPASLDNVPLDFGTLEPHGCFIGSAAVIVLSDQDDLRAVALNLLRFFEDESCGQCTPCRCGTEKAVHLMRHPHWDVPLLNELSQAMRDASICGLGQAATNPLSCLLRYFPEAVP